MGMLYTRSKCFDRGCALLSIRNRSFVEHKLVAKTSKSHFSKFHTPRDPQRHSVQLYGAPTFSETLPEWCRDFLFDRSRDIYLIDATMIGVRPSAWNIVTGSRCAQADTDQEGLPRLQTAARQLSPNQVCFSVDAVFLG